ncbi:MAG TPA: tetratricopeptide repeat protein [Stellaceae bacterium]|nr:tetratricopeptide repeat protein [Stellaceae bacterium]
MPTRLGEILIRQGYITQANLDAALARQSREGGRLGTNLVALGILTVPQLLWTLRNQQEVEAAIEICQRTLSSWETIYGAGHPTTNRARYNLSRALLAAGRNAEAATHAETALEGHRTMLGRDHEWTQESARVAAAARRAVARGAVSVE